MAGRGRGQTSTLDDMEELTTALKNRPEEPTIQSQQPMETEESASDDGSSSSSEKVVRGRGAYRTELNTIPANLSKESLKAGERASGQSINVLSNFIRIKPMEDRFIYSYRVDFTPNIESVKLRKYLLRLATKDILGEDLIYDGYHDARTGSKTPELITNLDINHPQDPDLKHIITLKLTGTVSPGSPEMIRLYNMNIKKALEHLGFFRVSASGSYVHPQLSTPIGNTNLIVACRGYNTAAAVHDEGDIMLKLEPCHKLMQRQNVLQHMMDIRKMGDGNSRENVQAMLVGKLVVPNYNRIIYRVEDVNFKMSPKSTFLDRKTEKEISFMEYFKCRYNVEIKDENQPLLRVIQNNRRKESEEGGKNKDIYVVPELCNMAGLTDMQRNDNRLKTDLIRSSQISPEDRVSHLNTLLKKLNTPYIYSLNNRWGHEYDTEPVKIKARTMNMEKIGVGRAALGPPSEWPLADKNTGSFEPRIMREQIARAPELSRVAIIFPKINTNHRDAILDSLKTAIQKIGLDCPGRPKIYDMNHDTPQEYINELRKVPDSATLIIVVLHNQNKDRYDAIKKLATCERGLITQVVTSRLLLDQRKSSGACVKIAVQIAAKIGGEPWFVDIPLVGEMICGYDTYHDTANRGRSYGAFVASMNTKFSRWFSKADSHDQLDELSAHLAENLKAALANFCKVNQNRNPRRVTIYRDGVSDGQLEFVFKNELKQIRKAIDDFAPGIKLTFIIVNKTTGARFYLQTGPANYTNPAPGSVIDNTVTRQGRYDFFLISQSTRHGSLTPTYYNVIYDENGLEPARQQALAYKLCFLYYNWTGTVRVPAPCQYAHKLALLCGEHLHAIPNSSLDDRLHFL